MKTLLIIIVALSISAFAVEFPESPKRQTPKTFWILSGAYIGSIVADGITTHQGQMHGGTETGTPWLYGRHPNNLRFYATNAAVATGRIYLSRKLIRSRRKPLQALGWAIMVYGVEEHTRAAYGNTQVDYTKIVFNPTPIDPGWHGGPIVGGGQ